MDMLDRIHKNMYGLHQLNEVTQFVDKDGETTDRFESLYKRLILSYPNEQNLYQDFYNKLFQYLEQDQFTKFPISFYDKKQFPRLIDVIRKLDDVINKINQLKSVKVTTNPDIRNIPKVYVDRELGITVYRCDTIFQSIKLGRETDLCTSSGLNGRDNPYYSYKYDSSGNQRSTPYFVYGPHGIFIVDLMYDGSYSYGDAGNNTAYFSSYDEMINDDMVSPDLQFIPEEVFEWVDQPIDEMSDIELSVLATTCKSYSVIKYIDNPSEDLQLKAVKRDWSLIRYLDDPSEQVQLAAVNQNKLAIDHINNPTEKVRLVVKTK